MKKTFLTIALAAAALNPGASLQIINGGFLKTRKGFKAPVGAKVVVANGKID